MNNTVPIAAIARSCGQTTLIPASLMSTREQKFIIVRGWGELHYDLEESGHRLHRVTPPLRKVMGVMMGMAKRPAWG